MSIPSISGGPASLITPPAGQAAPGAATRQPSAPPAAPNPVAGPVSPAAPANTAPGRTAPAKAEERSTLLQDAVKRANESVQALRSDLQFTVDDATGIEVVKFVDTRTREVIRQIPSDEMLARARRLDEIKGLLVKDNA